MHAVLRRPLMLRWSYVAMLALALAGCATTEAPFEPRERPMTATEGRALVASLMPAYVRDREGWAIDIFAAMATLDVAVTASNVCSIVAVVEQESSFNADPPVPNLPAIAWKEIERQRERAGVPRIVLDAALALDSPDGRSYRERLDKVRTERELSELFEDFIGMVPLGRTLLASRNPVRTGGPMQVSIAFAEVHAREHPYPYPVVASIRREVFTRRGGLYFGIAHLLDYPAPYDRPVYRYADFNAGRYASRNAAFQQAVTQLSGVPLALDGDLLRYEGDLPSREPGQTELATRAIAAKLRLTEKDVRRDLEDGKSREFERTATYTRVMALADQAAGRKVQRAVVPKIPLRSPKITRPLTTDWFAQRVAARHERCMARAAAAQS